MKFEPGKFYKTRDGQKAVNIGENPSVTDQECRSGMTKDCNRWFFPRHDWNKWEEIGHTRNRNDKTNGIIQMRVCKDCGLREFKTWSV